MVTPLSLRQYIEEHTLTESQLEGLAVPAVMGALHGGPSMPVPPAWHGWAAAAIETGDYSQLGDRVEEAMLQETVELLWRVEVSRDRLLALRIIDLIPDNTLQEAFCEI